MMRTCQILAAFAASALLSATPAAAQPKPSTPSASTGSTLAPPALTTPVATDASRKEAHAMADLLNIPQQTRNIVQAMRNQMIQATVQASNKPLDQAAKIVDEVLMPDFNAAVPQLTEALLEPWAVNFSAADLKGLHEFYATPLGQRLLKTVPIVSQESLAAGQGWGQRTFQETVKKHIDDLHARGLKF